MSTIFNSATDVEDAYYDAIEEGDLEKMMSVWADSRDIACLLPMQPMHHGREAIRELWKTMLDPEFKIDITVNHLKWIVQGNVAIHLLEEVVTTTDTTQRQPPIYASNVYHRDSTSWHLLLHINSPAPPPTGVLPPIPGS
jgi:uncharacterized protein (TIGR02246 family)